MTNRPSVLPEWANSTAQQTSGGITFPNKAEPPQALKDSGLLFEQGVAREHFNYQLDLINQWLTFIDASSFGLGMPILVDPALNPSFSSNIPVGWATDGTEAIGGTTYDVYKRTS